MDSYFGALKLIFESRRHYFEQVTMEFEKLAHRERERESRDKTKARVYLARWKSCQKKITSIRLLPSR